MGRKSSAEIIKTLNAHPFLRSLNCLAGADIRPTFKLFSLRLSVVYPPLAISFYSNIQNNSLFFIQWLIILWFQTSLINYLEIHYHFSDQKEDSFDYAPTYITSTCINSAHTLTCLVILICYFDLFRDALLLSSQPKAWLPPHLLQHLLTKLTGICK